MVKIGIVMGSDLDAPIMAKAAETLGKLDIDYKMTTISAHRKPDVSFNQAKAAKDEGLKIITAGTGRAAHLPGVCVAISLMPVIGISVKTSGLSGADSLCSIAQTPGGVPVATTAINSGANAGTLAAKILTTFDAELLTKLEAYSGSLRSDVMKETEKLGQIDYKEYLVQMK